MAAVRSKASALPSAPSHMPPPSLPRPTKRRPSSAPLGLGSPALRCRTSQHVERAVVFRFGGRMGQLEQLPLSPPVPSWLAAIGPHDSSHMRLHRTVQPPPRTRGLQRRSPQPSSFCQTPASHPKRRVDMHLRWAVCADTRLRARSLSFLGCLKLCQEVAWYLYLYLLADTPNCVFWVSDTWHEIQVLVGPLSRTVCLEVGCLERCTVTLSIMTFSVNCFSNAL